MSEGESKKDKREKKSEIMDQDCADAGVIGSMSLCFQFAEKCEPTVLVNNTLICEIV